MLMRLVRIIPQSAGIVGRYGAAIEITVIIIYVNYLNWLQIAAKIEHKLNWVWERKIFHR